jgi:hypothetical protein
LQDPPKFTQIWIFGLKKPSCNPGIVQSVAEQVLDQINTKFLPWKK